MTTDQSNEKKKAFTIAPAEQDWGQAIVTARRECLESEVHLGARVLFCYLLDMSLQRTTQSWFGVVTISTTTLAHRLNCGIRSIYDWVHELKIGRFLSVTKTQMPNAWDINTYHITALAPPGEPTKAPTQDGLWGGGRMKKHRKSPSRPGARAPLQEMHAENGGEENPVSSFSQENAGGNGKIVHLPTAENAAAVGENCRSQQQNPPLAAAKSAAGSSKKVHTGAAENAGGTGKKVHTSKDLQKPENQPVETPDRGKGKESPPKEGFEEGEWKAWKRKLAGLFPRELAPIKAELIKKRAEINANPGSYDLSAGNLSSETVEWLEFMGREMARLEASKLPQDKEILRDRQKQRIKVLADPKSYKTRRLDSAAQKKLDLINRKIMAVEEALTGPTA